MSETAGPERRLPDLVLGRAAATPAAVAVRDARCQATYAELVHRAQRLAARLRAGNAVPDSVVAVCADRSVELVVALLGILLADAAYLPLDPTHPTGRIAHMLSESRPVAVLADVKYHERLSAAGAGTVCSLDARDIGSLHGAGPGPPVRRPGTSDDLAYIIYTSGSTGRPKGVGIPHRGVVNRLRWMQDHLRLGVDDVVLQKTPYTFDVSVWEFFWPLIAGARLVMADPEGHRDPEYLAETIYRESVTTVHFVPSMLDVFVREPGLRRCSSLRRVIASGEPLAASLANRFADCHTADLFNLYGPTEASIDVTAWRCRRPEPGPSVPIGTPITGVEVYVARTDGALCGPGEPGELLLGGVCLARGYVGRPDLTEASFVPNPYTGRGRLYRTGDLVRQAGDGCLEYLGRLDHQVKVNGYRIELSEIEAVLGSHPAISQIVVLLREDVGPGPRLVAYVTLSGLAPLEGVAEHVAEFLPEPMRPSYVVPMAEFPVTDSGKCDRSRLPAPTRDHLVVRLTKART